MTASPLRVLVVGASIAGPSTAYWLARTGAHVTVIERFPHLRANGQNIDIRTTGVTIMRKIPGMEEAVRAKRPQLEGICLLRGDGKVYGTLRATGDADRQGLVSEYEVPRGDLAGILVGLSQGVGSDGEKGKMGEVRYVFGEQVKAIQYGDKHGGLQGPVRVEFASGSTAEEYDLVVACDGATSRTRAMAFGGSVRDSIHPVNTWAAYFSIKKDLINGSKIGHGYSAVGGRFVAVGQHPNGGNVVMLMGVHPRGKGDFALPFREALSQGDDALKRYITQHFKGAGWKMDEILDAMMTSSDFYASEMAQVKVPSLHRGRVVLVGDAGYAPGPTGTGTTLAMTGAYVLAGELGRHQGDLAAGLKAYEERMRPIINDMQKIPPLVPGIAAPQTAWGLWLRNNIFAFLTWTNVLEYAQRFFGGSGMGTDKYNLPDYEWKA